MRQEDKILLKFWDETISAMSLEELVRLCKALAIYGAFTSPEARRLAANATTQRGLSLNSAGVCA